MDLGVQFSAGSSSVLALQERLPGALEHTARNLVLGYRSTSTVVIFTASSGIALAAAPALHNAVLLLAAMLLEILIFPQTFFFV